MKVICIDGSWQLVPGFADTGQPDPKEGDILEVKNCVVDEYGEWYVLYGFEHTEYSTKKFIPLSSIDETEMIREYNKELV